MVLLFVCWIFITSTNVFIADVSDVKVLQEAADAVGYHVDVKTFMEDKTNPAREILLRNTDEAVQRGAFGVPRFLQFIFQLCCQ